MSATSISSFRNMSSIAKRQYFPIFRMYLLLHINSTVLRAQDVSPLLQLRSTNIIPSLICSKFNHPNTYGQGRYRFVHVQRYPISPDSLHAMLYIIFARPCSACIISGPPCSACINRRVNMLTLYNFGRQNVDVVASIP